MEDAGVHALNESFRERAPFQSELSDLNSITSVSRFHKLEKSARYYKNQNRNLPKSDDLILDTTDAPNRVFIRRAFGVRYLSFGRVLTESGKAASNGNIRVPGPQGGLWGLPQKRFCLYVPHDPNQAIRITAILWEVR